MNNKISQTQAIEQILLQAPFQREHWEVYADWLQLQGNIKGEKLSLMLNNLIPYDITLFQTHPNLQTIWRYWIAIDMNIPKIAMLLADAIISQLIEIKTVHLWADLLIQKLSIDKFPNWLIELALTQKKDQIISILHDVVRDYTRTDYHHLLLGLIKTKWQAGKITSQQTYNILNNLIDYLEDDIHIELDIVLSIDHYQWDYLNPEEMKIIIDEFLMHFESDAQIIQDYYYWLLL